MPNQSETTAIEAAAIRLDDGRIYTLPPPARHHNVISLINSRESNVDMAGDHQGFVTNDGTFVSRKVAWIIADRAGQITRLPGGVEGLLFSENLW